MKVRLTKRTIDAARYQGPGADYRWDTEVAAFAVRVYPSGRKSFVIAYRVRGKQRFLTLGRVGEMTLHQARTRALELLAMARRGEDPAASRDRARKSPTMQDVAERYLREYARLHKKPSTVENDERSFRLHVLPRLGRRKVVDIDRDDIAAIHQAMVDTPVAANTVRKLLAKALSLCEDWGWRPEGSNPCRRVKLYPEKSRERYLSREEVTRLSRTLDEADRNRTQLPQVVLAVRLLMLTGCRVGEILKLRWQDVDFERQCLHLPDSKTGPKTVYLNSAAVDLLKQATRVEGNPHVIPGMKAGRPMVHIAKQWQVIRKQAGLEDVRLHDLRHTYASFGVNSGLSLKLVGKLLGHARTATTERYAHLADAPVRQANEQIGAELAALMTARAEPLEAEEGPEERREAAGG